MKQSIKAFTVITTALTITACSAHTQLTSGNDYLSRYSPSQAQMSSSIDEDVRQIAAIEPNLQFPAQIGLARIERGRLTNAPSDELGAWGQLADDLGPAYGEIVPVSPFIASMVRPENTKLHAEHVVSDIRRASARQHLDYVLVYEVNNTSENESNALSLADLTILGLYVLPSRNVKVESTASALLLDVRNGYPYGTATAFAEAKKVATRAGSGSYRAKLHSSTKLDAVINLTEEVEVMFEDLYRELSD